MNRRQSSSGDPFEELLDGRTPDDSALARLLTAARAPGTRNEMAGLPAARTAFLDARQPRRAGAIRLPAATRTAAGRLFALKAVAAVSGATLVGGVAYAATDTNLLGGTDHRKHGPVASAPAEPRSGSTTRGVGPAPAGHSSPGAAHPASTGHSGGLSSSAHSAHPPRHGAP
ncbi:MAG: hypothetical protein QOI15_2871, partial [Pseudonocardiales bacterium]|nr:hypothetical protein [Pseudonocardiales bacterium]